MGEADDAVLRVRQVVDLLDGGEDCPQGDLFAEVLHREDARDEALGVHVADAGRLDLALHIRWIRIDVQAERLEDVADGDAVLGAEVLFAVHDDRYARRGGDYRGCGADDDALLAAVVGAADVEQAFDARAG